MNKKCPNCNIINFPDAETCVRCGEILSGVETIVTRKVSSCNRRRRPPRKTFGAKIVRRAAICAAVCVAVIFCFYLSLLFTSKSLAYEEKQTVKGAVAILEAKGFDREVFFLRYVTSFRGNDNWLNASTRDENAYAATNFPFEIITIYPEFFNIPQDDTERAMILLHEAQHLKGADEKEAYEYVWRSRHRLGWTRETHAASKIFINVEKQTREFAPDLFRCEWKAGNDCTENQLRIKN